MGLGQRSSLPLRPGQSRQPHEFGLHGLRRIRWGRYLRALCPGSVIGLTRQGWLGVLLAVGDVSYEQWTEICRRKADGKDVDLL
jgi:hypothetical protein